jgi:hypothetical protein
MSFEQSLQDKLGDHKKDEVKKIQYIINNIYINLYI